VPTFVCGDFNVNLRSGDSSVRILSELTAYHGFIQYVKQPTHRKGGTLDHIYVNRFFDDWTFVSDSCSLFRPFPCSSCSAVSESCVDPLTSEVVIHVVVYKCYGWFKFLFNIQIRRNWWIVLFCICFVCQICQCGGIDIVQVYLMPLVILRRY
jgi:hypothetical protein